MKEKRDLYDLNKNLTNEVINKGDIIPKNRKMLVVAIWIEDLNGKFLVQKRKKGEFWSITSGHPKAGETSLEGILTEAKEELNLDISNCDIKLIDCSSDELHFIDLYYVKMDIDLNKLILQQEEVIDVKLVSLEEISDLIKNKQFFTYHIEKFEKLLDYKNIKLLKI